MKVIFIFTWRLTTWAQAYYRMGEVLVVKNGTSIEATTSTLAATVTLTITNVSQLKTIVEVKLKEPAS